MIDLVSTDTDSDGEQVVVNSWTALRAARPRQYSSTERPRLTWPTVEALRVRARIEEVEERMDYFEVAMEAFTERLAEARTRADRYLCTNVIDRLANEWGRNDAQRTRLERLFNDMRRSFEMRSRYNEEYNEMMRNSKK